MAFTKGQDEFIDQQTRALMVAWCDRAIRDSDFLTHAVSAVSTQDDLVYAQYATNKKWLSAPDPVGDRRILAAGWAIATSFLKR